MVKVPFSEYRRLVYKMSSSYDSVHIVMLLGLCIYVAPFKLQPCRRSNFSIWFRFRFQVGHYSFPIERKFKICVNQTFTRFYYKFCMILSQNTLLLIHLLKRFTQYFTLTNSGFNCSFSLKSIGLNTKLILIMRRIMMAVLLRRTRSFYTIAT